MTTKHIPRIFINDHLNMNQIFCLSKDNTHYIKQVLRMQTKDILEIFNNTNYIFFAEIIFISKTTIKIKILTKTFQNIESPIHIHLGQVISRYEKMDFTIQKSIEMGVNIITPLFSENTNYQIKKIDLSTKIKRWKKIAISACQQCKRNIIPTIKEAQNIFTWCAKNKTDDMNIVFHPQSQLTMNNLPKSKKCIKIIIGPEGGFSTDEIKKIIKYGFVAIKLGPRILRTETASIAAITGLQMKFGDLTK